MKSLNMSAWLHSTFHHAASSPEHETTRFNWQSVSEWLAEHLATSDDPQVVQKHDRHGQLYWEVYDPHTNREFRSTSEAEVRQWLEERYYWQSDAQ